MILRRFLIATSLVMGFNAHAALDLGVSAPDFTLQAATAGALSPFSLHEALKNGPVVLYFFPAAFTSGCNREAHTFAEHIQEFKNMHATVIGVSNDTPDTLQKFSTQECAGQFAVGADPESTVIKAYDVKFPLVGKAQRVSFVIAPDGHIRHVYSSLTDPEGHISKSLEALKALQ